MPNANLTAEFVRDLPFVGSGQTFYRDTKLTGFAVKVGKTAKTYTVERRVRGRVRRVVLGPTSNMTVKDARKLAQKTLTGMLDGNDPNRVKAEERAKGLTLGEALELYLSDHALKENTAAENRRLINNDFGDWLDKDVKGITPTQVVKRFDRISDRSPTVANHACWVLRAILNYARILTKTDAGEYTLPPNPCQRLTDLNRWHKSNARTGRLTEEQFPAFFQALADADNPAFADYMELLVRTGLRRTEAASLLWADVSLTKKTFHVRAEIAKNGQALTLPMSTQIETLFQRRREAAPDALKVFGDAQRYDPRKSLLRLRTAIGSDLTYHDCRRTFLTIAEEQAVPYGLLKKMGNHSAGNDVTLKHYVNTVEHETLRPYMQTVNDQIDRLGGIYNEGLKIRDQIARLRQICDDLTEFKRFSCEIKKLQAIADRITETGKIDTTS